MPHLTLEYTSNLVPPADLAGVLVELHHLIADVGGIQVEKFKSRAVRREVFAIGGGEGDGGFVHLEIDVFAGRTRAVKEEIGRGSLAILGQHFAARDSGPTVQITVEIRDMDREGYFKQA